MKKIIFTLVVFSACIANGQIVPSSCNAPDSVISQYKTDADQLALRRVYRTGSSFIDSVNIPKAWSDTILRALLAVYNATSLPARDTVVILARIHTYPIPFFLNYLYVYADSNLSWMQQLKAGNLITGNDTIDQLISIYDLDIYKYWSHAFYNKPYDAVMFHCGSNYNIAVLVKYFKPVYGVYNSESTGPGSDGNNISDSVYTNYVELNYSIGWGDCPAGCTARRTWKFHVYYDCSVEYMGSYGQYPIPPELISDIKEYSYQIKIYPNPITNNLFIEIPQPSTIQILTIQGQIIKTIPKAEKETTIDLRNLSSGVYIIKAITEKGIAVRKFIKE